jgi:hypothetical protein
LCSFDEMPGRAGRLRRRIRADDHESQGRPSNELSANG